MPESIYLDYVSTTPVNPQISDDMTALTKRFYANADALYDSGRAVHDLIERSRSYLAQFFGVSSREVMFTSGASEANSAIIKGVAFANQAHSRLLVTSRVEHSSTLEAFRQLEQHFGFEVVYLDVDHSGKVNLEQLAHVCARKPSLVSLMMINNETGSINPIAEIIDIVKTNHDTYLHMDGVQALGKYPIQMGRIDAMSFSAHKIYGLKGSGLLIKKAHVPFLPLINGGAQEFGQRGGTSNSVSDILFAKTVRLVHETFTQDLHHVQALNQYLRQNLDVNINSPLDASPYILNFSVPDMTSEVMMNALNARGICVSAQSTCSYDAHRPSPVLMAMGYDERRALSSIRISLSHLTTKDEVLAVCTAIGEIISHVHIEL